MKLRRIFFESKIPDSLHTLQELAHNLWWCWHADAIELFRSIHPQHWLDTNQNPVALIAALDMEELHRLEQNADFQDRLQKVYRQFRDYMETPARTDVPSVGYFCMEYGLHASLRIYSGGLGILAGDYLKEASDCNLPMIGIGLMYRYGYFQQSISLHGEQIHNYLPQQFTRMPAKPVRTASGDWLKVSVDFPWRTVYAKVWELNVGRIKLYLLDANVEENTNEDKEITDRLYGGDTEHRLRQEILLGIGGKRAAQEMGLQFDVFHCNEGHAAFLGIERLKNYMQRDKLPYDTAIEMVRAKSLFTTHTPVPAGHDYFSEDLLKKYLWDYIQNIGIGWHTFIAMGRINPHDSNERFSMSHLAIRLSQEVNGVSKLHGEVSQKMFNSLYQGYTPEELHIGYVTNGVHYPTWIAKPFHDLFGKYLDKELLSDQSNLDIWKKIHEVPDKEISEVRTSLKKNLLAYLRKKMHADLTKRGQNPRTIFELMNSLDDQALIIGFARRFATYKRAHLIFSNLDRLTEIISNAQRPVIFVFAGKAHPADQGGQDLIRQIVQVSLRKEFFGKIYFLEDYDMEVARMMVQGVDIWLNTPTRPKEASGTSGMKACMNGVLNLSVLDGWWAEGYQPEAGWSLPLEATYEDQKLQNELDAETIYNLIEYEIVPAFFDRDKDGISKRWIGYIKNNLALIAPRFTMKRMIDDYLHKFYHKLAKRSAELEANSFLGARAIASWKKDIALKWEKISIRQVDLLDAENQSILSGATFKAAIKVGMQDYPSESLQAEVIFYKRLPSGELDFIDSKEMQQTEWVHDQLTLSCSFPSSYHGVLEYGIRLTPKHPLLPHRQDLNLVKWVEV